MSFVMRRPQRHSDHLCPYFREAMNLLAKPWNGEIIATLSQRDSQGEGQRGQSAGLRFSEFGDLIGIGDRMLSVRLRELEARGLVDRVVDGGPPVRVSYRLTEVGRGFGGVQAMLSEWGTKLVRHASRRHA